MTAPSIKLNNGVEIAAVGLGFYLASPEGTISAVAAMVETR